MGRGGGLVALRERPRSAGPRARPRPAARLAPAARAATFSPAASEIIRQYHAGLRPRRRPNRTSALGIQTKVPDDPAAMRHQPAGGIANAISTSA